MKTFLVIGKDGQIGGECLRILGGKYKAVGLSREDADISDKESVLSALRKYKPSIVINAVAYTDIEAAEKDRAAAFSVNAESAGIVAAAVAECKVPIVHFSTDYVFDGKKEYYTEDDAPNPLNAYGASKYEGEKLVAAGNPMHYIIRTSAVFGGKSRKGKFLPTMIRLAEEGKTIKCISDQYTSPTYTADLIGAVSRIIDKKAPYGIYHVTNAGEASWFDFAQAIFEAAGLKADLHPIPMAEYGFKTKRAYRSVLKSSMLAKAGIKELRSWKEALKSLDLAVIDHAEAEQVLP